MSVKLASSRIPAIDTFRGLTILLMIFVNELAGVSGIPGWMKHAVADEDAMTFVDVVFPAFLFIVGMSIPFSIQAHRSKGMSWIRLSGHVAIRALGLVVMGVFMVNAEGDYNEEAMGMSIHVWTLLFYAGVFLVWFDYPSSPRLLSHGLRVAGIILLLVLAFLYRDEGGSQIGPRWWGILGLIGWAYLLGTGFYLLSNGSRFMLLLLILGCLTYYTLGHYAFRQNPFYSHPLFSQGGHAVHTAIVLAGVTLSLIFYRDDMLVERWQRYRGAILLAFAMFIAGIYFRPMMGISKSFATPSWAAFSVVTCVLMFALLYLVIDHWKLTRWTTVLSPAGNNPLLVYVLPYIIYAFMQAAGISFPEFLYQGGIGILWALCYAVLVMLTGWMLVRVNVRLKL